MTDDFENTNGDEVPIDDMGGGDSFGGGGFDNSPTDDDKLWALLAYVFTPLVPIIILLMADKKDRPFIKAHNMQALVWGVLNVIVSVLIGWLLCGLPSIVMWLVGVYWGWQAYQGQEVTIPVITDFVKGQGWA